MKNFIAFVLLAGITFSLSSFSSVQKCHSSKWEVLGQKVVGLHGDHDELKVTAKEGLFTKLKFKVVDAPIYVRNIKVVYANGTSENHKINRKYSIGSSSKALDLNGGHRIIKKIVFNYDTINNGNGRAKVIAIGKH